MQYTEFTRPNGDKSLRYVKLDKRAEALAAACTAHDNGIKFTREDIRTTTTIGTFANLCFEAYVDDEDGDPDVDDVVCELIKTDADMKAAWEMVVAKAADHLNIHTGEFA